MDFIEGVELVKQGFDRAFLILKSMPIRVYPFSFVKNFINSGKLQKIVPNPKDIDFMDEVLFKWFKALSEDEAFIITAYSLKARRKEIALKLNLSRQALHKKYEKALSKVLFYLISQGIEKNLMLDKRN